MESITVKRCSKCKNIKSISEFGSNRSTKDGRNCYCKTCACLSAKESKARNHENTLAGLRKWRKKNAEKIKDYSLKYYWEHRETLLDDEHKAANKSYRNKNKEQLRIKDKKRYEANKETVLERAKRYVQNNRERVLKNKAEYYRKNKKTFSLKNLIYRITHSEQIKEIGKKYRENNKEKIRAGKVKANHIRRARRRGAEGTFTEAEWISALEKYGCKCLRCGSSENLTRDHVIPLSRGGTNTIDNIQPLCISCNSWKHTKIIDYRHA
jgi:5-methylcytosine-specific restriction endonuclease McrA